MTYKVICKDKEIVFTGLRSFADHFGLKSIRSVEMWLEKRCKPPRRMGIEQVYVDSLLILDLKGVYK